MNFQPAAETSPVLLHDVKIDVADKVSPKSKQCPLLEVMKPVHPSTSEHCPEHHTSAASFLSGPYTK